MNAKMADIADMASFSYEDPFGVMEGSIGLSTGGSYTYNVDSRVETSNSYLTDRLTHTAEDVVGSYIEGGSSSDASKIISGFTGF